MFKLEPYLLFNGNCEEAFEFYKSVFGGEFTSVLRYKDMPENVSKVDEQYTENILHINLPIGNIMLMGSDSDGHPVNMGNNVSLSLSVDDQAEAQRLFEMLSEGGEIRMPLAKTFWSKLHAMFTDRFGINWMINYGTSGEQ